jgi:protein O-mannosyl-transferase
VLTWRARVGHPFAPVGWLWYVITLLPVIGIVQVGGQARADRYTYIPSIGLTILLVWGVSEPLQRRPAVRKAVAAAVCAACLVLTWIQLQYWRDSVALYEHAIACTSDNYLAQFNLASVLDGRGERLQAIEHLREAVRIRPASASAHGELGQLLAKERETEDALRELETAVALTPDSAEVHFRLGSVLGALGRNSEAADQFRRVAQLDPENADAHFNLGIALAQEGHIQEAAQEFSETVQLRPQDVDARFNLAIALLKADRLDDALKQLSEVLRLRPDFKEAREVLDEASSRKSGAHRK